MNRHGLADLNRREFSGVQLEVVRLDRANGTIKERLNSDAFGFNLQRTSGSAVELRTSIYSQPNGH